MVGSLNGKSGQFCHRRCPALSYQRLVNLGGQGSKGSCTQKKIQLLLYSRISEKKYPHPTAIYTQSDTQMAIKHFIHSSTHSPSVLSNSLGSHSMSCSTSITVLRLIKTLPLPSGP